MTDRPNQPDRADAWYRQPLIERHELRDLSRELIDYLSNPRPDVEHPEAHGWASGLYGQLTRLHEKVTESFRCEESTAMLEKLTERYPRAAQKLDQLQQERRRHFDKLRRLVDATMRYAEADPPDEANLRERTRSLLESIVRHEQQTTDLIQDLVSVDVGTGD